MFGREALSVVNAEDWEDPSLEALDEASGRVLPLTKNIVKTGANIIECAQ